MLLVLGQRASILPELELCPRAPLWALFLSLALAMNNQV